MTDERGDDKRLTIDDCTALSLLFLCLLIHQYCLMTHRFNEGIRGDCAESLAAVRHEQTHFAEELGVLECRHLVRLALRIAFNAVIMASPNRRANRGVSGGDRATTQTKTRARLILQ